MEKITSLPGGGLTAVTQFKLKTATRTRDRVVSQRGITPERDNP
ncbi:MAG: hypothetical protein ACRD72_04825 [Candidatus Angelobacter sp.]|nr:hypothetical protein [Candidatus Limnocylindrales bacterium]